MVETHELNDEEWAAHCEAVCQRNLGHDMATFMERWESGEYSYSHDLENHCGIVHVAMLLPELD